MARTAINPTLRTLIVLLAVVAGILMCAIFVVAANSPGRARIEASLAEAKNEAEEARKEATERIEELQQENADLRKQVADLRKQLEVAKADLDRRAGKVAAAEQDALRLRGELDAALKQTAELSQKYADARVKKAEDATAEALDAQRKAKLDADALKKDRPVTVVKAPPAEVEVVQAGKKHNRKNGKNNNVAANKKRGSVASLPRTSPSFSELDTDQDGRLSLAEYKAGFPDAPNVEEEFKTLDTNGDGWLSIDEYKAGHPDPPVVRTRRAKQN